MAATREERAEKAAAALNEMFQSDGDDPATEVVTEVPAEAGAVSAPPTEPVKTEQNGEKPEENSGLAAIARAEARSRELYEKQQAELAKEKEELLSARGQVEQFQDWQKRFRESPLEGVRELMGDKSMTDDSIVEMFYGSLPGVDAEASDKPNQVDARLSRIEQENQKLRDEIVKKDERRAQTEFQQSYVNDITSYLSDETTQSDPEMGILNAYFAAFPQELVADIFGHATTMASENPNDPLVKPAEVAKNVSERLTKIFGPVIDARVKELTEGKTHAATKKTPAADNRTLMNSASSTTKADDGKPLSRKQIRDNAIAWAKAGNIDLG